MEKESWDSEREFRESHIESGNEMDRNKDFTSNANNLEYNLPIENKEKICLH